MMSAVVGMGAMVSASSKAATERDLSTAAVPVAVETDVDVEGAVSAAAEQARIDAVRRIRSAPLPESIFSPSQGRRGKQRTTVVTTRKNNDINSTASGVSSDGFPQKKVHVVSAPTAAAVTIAGEGIHVGVREALDRWALQM